MTTRLTIHRHTPRPSDGKIINDVGSHLAASVAGARHQAKVILAIVSLAMLSILSAPPATAAVTAADIADYLQEHANDPHFCVREGICELFAAHEDCNAKTQIARGSARSQSHGHRPSQATLDAIRNRFQEAEYACNNVKFLKLMNG